MNRCKRNCPTVPLTELLNHHCIFCSVASQISEKFFFFLRNLQQLGTVNKLSSKMWIRIENSSVILSTDQSTVTK